MTVSQVAYTSSAYRSLTTNSAQALKSLNRISSGYRINSAADDAAGLAISERMRGQIGGLSKASENTQQAISMVQTAEGSLDKSTEILTRMQELTVQAASGTYSNADRALLDVEFQQLKGSLDQIASSSHYNGIKLLDGSLGGKQGDAGISDMGVSQISTTGNLTGEAKFTISSENGVTSITAQIGDQTVTNQIGAADTDTTFAMADGNTIKLDFGNTGANLTDGVITNVKLEDNQRVDTSKAMSGTDSSKITFQVGANNGADQRISLGVGDMSTLALGLRDANILSVDSTNAANAAVDSAKSTVVSQRSVLGATQNRLEYTMNNLALSHDNMVESESTIRDADIAREMMNYTQKNIMVQAAQAMMAQGMNLSRSNMLFLLTQ